MGVNPPLVSRADGTRERLLALALLLAGLALRLRQYLAWRSLWLDEAMLALNVVNRGYAALLEPLDFDQGAPVGFLLAVRLLLVTLGDNEFVLRLFPFLMGVLALGLFLLLLRRTTAGPGLAFGLALFALGPELVYYSSEFKQYIVDVAAATGLLLLALAPLRGEAGRRGYAALALAGVLAMWFSHPALFVLAGIGAGLMYAHLRRADARGLRWSLAAGAAWLANLALLYAVSLRALRANDFLRAYWVENFMPWPPWSAAGWFQTVFAGFVRAEVGLEAPGWLVGGLLLAGLGLLWKGERPLAIALVTTPLCALAASAFGLYPFGGRLSLFLVPSAVLALAGGLQAFAGALPRRAALGNALAGVLALALLYAPAANALEDFRSPKYYEHLRPAMAAIADGWRQGQAVFASYGAYPAYRYYAARYGLESASVTTVARPDYGRPESMLPALQTLDGHRRVWVLITHVYERPGFNEREYLLAHLDTLGEQVREIGFPGTSVYLYLYDLGP